MTGKRILSLLLAALLVVGLLPATTLSAQAETIYITDRSLVDGNDYSSCPEMVDKLNGIFDGNISVYKDSRCTNLVDARIGTSNMLNNNVYQFVGPYGGPYLKAGTSCWVYANGVYYTLFGECTSNNDSATVGYAGENSYVLSLSSTSNKYASYEHFLSWGVRNAPGALIRAQNHSMIVLGYDENALTIIDGNGNGRGLVSIRVRPWSDVTFRVDYIIQPKEEFYYNLYPACDHQYSGLGVCALCQAEYKWERSYNTDCAGLYTVAGDEPVYPRPALPYEAAAPSLTALEPGAEVAVLGSVKNAFGELWYKVRSQSLVGFVKAEALTYADLEAQQISCVVSAPAEGEIVPKRSYPLGGTITSRYPLAEVNGYIDGQLYATVTLGSQDTFTLKSSKLDNSLSFSSLAVGPHTLTITARDIYREEAVTVCTRTFVTESGASVCSHAYTGLISQSPTCIAPGEMTYTCEKCSAVYTEILPPLEEHCFSPYVETAPTCSKEGLERYVCQSCNTGYTQVLPATGEHTYECTQVAATCTEYAKLLYTCTGCPDSYLEDAPLTLSDWVTEHPEDAKGLESRQEYRYRDQEFTSSTQEALEGWTAYEQTTQWGDFGPWSQWSETPVTPDDHTQVESRTAYKYGYYLCPNCGAHMYAYDITCPSWAGGCGKVTLQLENYVPVWSEISYNDANLKNFHGVGRYYTTINGETVFKPSQTETQTQYRFCARTLENVTLFYRWNEWSDWSCEPVEAAENRQIEERTTYRYITTPLGDHDYTPTVTPPTCTAGGYTTFRCAVCEDTYVGDHTDPAKHDYAATVTPPTCTAGGYTTFRCAVCEDTYVGDHTDPAKHDYAATVTPPTCTAGGYTTFRCAVCEDTYVGDRTDPAPHSYEEGFCSVCGAEDPDFKPLLVAIVTAGVPTASYTDFSQALAELEEGSVLQLLEDVETTCLVEGDLWVDLNGHTLSGLSLTGTLYGIDSSTDGYRGDTAGRLILADGTVAPHIKTTTAQTGAVRRYLAIPEAEGYSFHRFYFGVTHAVIQPGRGGIGYRAAFAGDEAVKAYLDPEEAFGLTLSTEQGATFRAAFPAEEFAAPGKALSKSLLLENVLDPECSWEELAQRAQLSISVSTFLKTRDGLVITSGSVSASMQELVEQSDAAYPTAAFLQKAALLRLYAAYEPLMNQWALPNIKNSLA